MNKNFALMRPGRFLLMPFFLLSMLSCSQRSIEPEKESPGSWHFALSGDSRNCGDVIMPAIAQNAIAHQARFYVHLGDFRALYKIDEDFSHDPQYQKIKTLEDYRIYAWQDFIENQLKPFGKTPVYLGIGNHETINRDRSEYLATFHSWLEQAPLVAARKMDGGNKDQIYYHWIQNGVDFIMLDNATDDQFDAAQMKWFQKVIHQAEMDPTVQTIVVGMHKALPDSISFGHSMSESKNPISVTSGRAVYQELLKAQNENHKNVYVMGSHSHFFMEGTFNTDYWKNNGGVLPGWIVGTAGAQRIPLPDGAKDAKIAKTKIYGYLLATVEPQNGNKIRFDFQEIDRNAIPESVTAKYGKELVDFCFDQNVMDKKY